MTKMQPIGTTDIAKMLALHISGNDLGALSTQAQRVHRQTARDLIRALDRARSAKGWVTVPREMTQEQHHTASCAYMDRNAGGTNIRRAYEGALSAAPPCEEPGDE